MTIDRRTFLTVSAAAAASAPTLAETPKSKKLVLIAGTPSHPPGAHEHNAGVLLFQKCLAGVKGLEVSVCLNGYPRDDSILDDADGMFLYADGGNGHPFVQGKRRERIGRLLSRGVGLFCCHFAVEVPREAAGETFRDWIGGYYETGWSCNPMWKAEFKALPDHPICRGVQPFAIHDEWYINMRFRPALKGITPILTATPTDATRDGPYVHPRGPYKHILQARGQAEHLMWCVERSDGGRGVGFTGGHFHANWQNDQFRKLALNAMLWICKEDVPGNGVASTVTEEDMTRNLDPKPGRK